MRALIATIALGVVAACGGGRGARTPPGASSAPAEPDAAVVDRAMLAELAAGLEEVLATMADITVQAADCPEMARQLAGLFDKSAPLFDLVRAQGADPAASPVLAAELDARAAAVQPLVERIGQGLARCQLDPDVARVMERMPTL